MTLRPIDQWPHGLTGDRRRSNFSAPWADTIDKLGRELWYLGKGNTNAPAVLQIALRDQDFRIDGMPRANAIAAHPGVILNIESRHGPLSYPCDTFTRWQDNLRAIALGLEALRKVERYGITQTGQQYRGWQAIEAKATPIAQTAAGAAVHLAKAAQGNDDSVSDWAHRILHDPETARNTYRKARANTHPDRHGGDRTAWNAVESAANILRAAGAPIE
ncbi:MULTISPECIES: molecular chaperone DnaJ [Mycobacteroides]|uniref:molecular chaperone DnaJ n=1 Tax=Mycobacteroides TaxID=670516 RepID=UPI001F3A7AE3|nr:MULTISPECIES: molecular chaperone DnaJ [Mycobacteroides]MDO3312377.1 molecular chaperone DnaJ [Mycobacteroides abscessus subsp. abscessus]MDO3344941.1 molecular chaperone DnaJ [Mycobacteroides abscessus subsp. abscessus]WJR32443.1 molecular chaperone DnaJ [Mycobacteroides immunogenum]